MCLRSPTITERLRWKAFATNFMVNLNYNIENYEHASDANIKFTDTNHEISIAYFYLTSKFFYIAIANKCVLQDGTLEY